MADDNKNSNFLIFGLGIVATFFAYLIYIIHKENQLITQQIPIQQIPQYTQPVIQPIIIQQPPVQQPIQPLNSVELYKISEQLKLQNNQIQSIQDQQMNQNRNISQIESTKCSNVVSMNDGIYPSINNMTQKIPKQTNVGRENEEYVSNKIFGMK